MTLAGTPDVSTGVCMLLNSSPEERKNMACRYSLTQLLYYIIGLSPALHPSGEGEGEGGCAAFTLLHMFGSNQLASLHTGAIFFSL